MKIALVWNHRSRLLDCSFRFEQYLSGFRALGHQPVVVCDEASAEGFDGPLEVAGSAERFKEPDFWRRIAAEVAVIVTWHRMSTELAAMRAAGTRVISIADTDGRLSARTYPGAALERLMVYQESLIDRLRCLEYWLVRYLRELAHGSEEDAENLASTRASNAVIFGHELAEQNFNRFLAGCGEQALGGRLAVVPFAIGGSFLSCPVPETKSDRIVAIGRWRDPQKNAGLLAGAISRLLDTRSSTEVVVLGDGGDRWFAPLARRHQAVSVVGVQAQEFVAHTLADSRSIVFSSRWEGSPHAALEALALGATVVGPRIPSLASWSEGGRFGTISGTRRPSSLARALSDEMTAWDAGRRTAVEISEHWRARLAPEIVCRRMLEAITPPPSS